MIERSGKPSNIGRVELGAEGVTGELKAQICRRKMQHLTSKPFGKTIGFHPVASQCRNNDFR
jgi:hypothetical protein